MIVLRLFAMLVSCLSIGAMIRPVRCGVPLLLGIGAAFWMHLWLPLFIGLGIGAVLAGFAGVDWIQFGEH